MKEKLYLVDEDLRVSDRYKTVPASKIKIIETEFSVDFTELDLKQKTILTKDFMRRKIDAYIGQEFYIAIRNLTSDILSNPRFWQWLTLVRFRELTELRLDKTLSETPPPNLLSGISLNHTNRNFFQRIYNILKIAYPQTSIEDKFKLGNQLLSNQDAITSICDRDLGLNVTYIRKHLENIAKLGSVETQQYVKKLNAKSQVFLPDYL